MDYERSRELKAFNESKAGVKGLVDSGTVNIPNIFILPSDELEEESKRCRSKVKVPIIDLSSIGDRRKEVVNEVRQAAEKWGFFQLVNHGIPMSVLSSMIDGVLRFHEQDLKVKEEFFSLDRLKAVRYNGNQDLYQSRVASWRDSLTITMLGYDDIHPQQLPAACRDATVEYIKHVTKLGDSLFELLSEALGLREDHLKGIECAGGRTLGCNYYPACPVPELTMGTTMHSDPAFLTLLLQNHIGGLQFLHQNQLIDVPPIEGALLVNIGDLLQVLAQMVSNDKFKSANHRVLANHVGPTISVVSFFTGVFAPTKTYGPIKELLSKENSPVYKQFVVSDYLTKFFSKPIDVSGPDLFKI